MADYIDLVACKHMNNDRSFLFKAPKFSYLDKGDKVMVETKHGNAEATVEASYTIDPEDNDLMKLILSLNGAELPLKKVLKKIKYIDFEYKEDEEHE